MDKLDIYLNEIYSKSLQNNYLIHPSPIHGMGIFANKDFAKGEIINTHIDKTDKLTQFGAFLNHSFEPSAHSSKEKDGSYQTYAEKNIKKGDEVTLDYTVNKDLEQPEEGWK